MALDRFSAICFGIATAFLSSSGMVVHPGTDQVSEATLRYEADRENWNRPAQVIAALKVGPGGIVADIGAGAGYFTLKLARVVGSAGTVYAVDTNPSAVRDLQARVAADRLANVKVLQGSIDDPRLPPGKLDAVLIMDAYHEMVEHVAMLRAIHRALKPAGRLVILERADAKDAGKPREVQTRRHHIESRLVARELGEAGFGVIDRVEAFAEFPAGGTFWRIVAVPRSRPRGSQP